MPNPHHPRRSSLRLFSALKLNRALAKVQVPAACSPLHIPLAIDYRGASPLSQPMVRSASNRLIRRHDNEITKLK